MRAQLADLSDSELLAWCKHVKSFLDRDALKPKARMTQELVLAWLESECNRRGLAVTV